MPQLDPSSFSSQLFWLVITFGLLYFVIAKFALPEIGKVLRQRQDRILSDIEQAETLKEEAKVLKEEYENSLQSTKEKAHEIIARATEDAADKAASRHSELDEVVAEKLAEADKVIAKAEKEVASKFTPIAASLAQQIVEKLTGKSVDEKSATNEVSKLMKGA